MNSHPTACQRCAEHTPDRFDSCNSACAELLFELGFTGDLNDGPRHTGISFDQRSVFVSLPAAPPARTRSPRMSPTQVAASARRAIKKARVSRENTLSRAARLLFGEPSGRTATSCKLTVIAIAAMEDHAWGAEP